MNKVVLLVVPVKMEGIFNMKTCVMKFVHQELLNQGKLV